MKRLILALLLSACGGETYTELVNETFDGAPAFSTFSNAIRADPPPTKGPGLKGQGLVLKHTFGSHVLVSKGFPYTGETIKLAFDLLVSAGEYKVPEPSFWFWKSQAGCDVQPGGMLESRGYFYNSPALTGWQHLEFIVPGVSGFNCFHSRLAVNGQVEGMSMTLDNIQLGSLTWSPANSLHPSEVE